MFFLGDSGSYLLTAIGPWIPPDRSFLYGWLIRLLSVGTHSLIPLVAAQTLAAGMAAMLCTFNLRRYFGVSATLAAAMGILCAVEPLQLLYERYVMTESFSLMIFAAFTTLALGYLKAPSLVRITLVQFLGILLVSFRVSFLPVVELTTLFLPLLAIGVPSPTRQSIPASSPAEPPIPVSAGTSPEASRTLRITGHWVLSCILFLALHGGYKRLYAGLIQFELPNAPPAYYYENGFHLLSFVAPIVKPGDFPIPEKAPQIFHNLAFDLRDYRTRDKQRWLQGGLIANLRSAYPDPLQANRLADQTAWNAVKRDPLGELYLAGLGFLDYWNLDRLRTGMITDRGGDRELPPELLALLREHFGLAAETLPHLSTLTNRYFFAAWGWYLALLLLPLPAFLTIWICPREQRPGAILICLFATVQTAVIAAFSMEPTVRFLHAPAWLSMIILGVSIHWIQDRHRTRQPGGSATHLNQGVTSPAHPIVSLPPTLARTPGVISG
jgi:hypothetical protein